MEKFISALHPLIEIIDITALLVAIVGIGMAWIHAIDLKKLLRTTSTRYLDKEFPSYLADISKLISGARRSVEIFCDFPAYGTLSGHELFDEYKRQLKKKQDLGKGKIRIVCLQKAVRRVAATKFLSGELFMPAKERSKKFKQRLDRLLALHRHESEFKNERADGISPRKILDLIEAEDNLMLEHLDKADVQDCINEPIPVFFWLVDGNRAIFSVMSLLGKGMGMVEYGFFTRDKDLIKALSAMRDLYVERSMKPPVISSVPNVMGASPVLRGTRVHVKTLLGCLEAGASVDDFLEVFPSVQMEQVIAFLE